MKNIFRGYFKPSNKELKKLWGEATFVFDANVLLNLYRYSDAAQEELKKAIELLGERVFIPHQAAQEFLSNRLSVTSSQSKEYKSASDELENIVSKFKAKSRHPYIKEKHIEELELLQKKIVDDLNERMSSLLARMTKDKILDFAAVRFENRTGKPTQEEKLNLIFEEGEQRYADKLPPGYMDAKSKEGDERRVYGDLIVWKQMLEFAESKKCSVIFITDDKKEDWWQIESGKTIGPRPELIEEFKSETQQKFWMYNVSSFLKLSAQKDKRELEESIFDELQQIREQVFELGYVENERFISKKNSGSIITVIQQPAVINELENTGKFVISLDEPTRYATGTGKFRPNLQEIPSFGVRLTEAPLDEAGIRISYGCGTNKDFNIHIKSKYGLLPAGDYVFDYTATINQSLND